MTYFILVETGRRRFEFVEQHGVLPLLWRIWLSSSY